MEMGDDPPGGGVALELSGVLSQRTSAAGSEAPQSARWTKLDERRSEGDGSLGVPAAREGESRDYVHVMSLFLASSCWTLLMTAFPVMVTLPEDLYKPHDGWYVGNDIVRLLEPVVSLPLNFWILHSSGVFTRPGRPPVIPVSIFMVGAAIYQQGAAMHSSAVMYKHPVKQIKEQHPDVVLVHDLYEWLRRVWEHDVSHYVYAFGGVVMAAVHAWVFKDGLLPEGLQGCKVRALWALASITYGVIIGSVAIQFPSGSAIALAFLLGYGFAVVGGYYLWIERDRRRSTEGRLWWWTWGRRPVLQYFLHAYAVALLIVLAWIIKSRGFVGRNGSF